MQRQVAHLKQRQFDLLVCGGGIYGAWTAYDAALRGLNVAIIDQSDWASGTSSASSKLIHGGLRYLEHFDFKLVKKSLLERQILLQTAPHRVWPLRFGIPVYRHGRLGAFKLKLGLFLYDWLADRLPNSEGHQQLSRKGFISHFPFLKCEQLTQGFTYLDAQTDDARFVIELIDGAVATGAVCVNYCEAVNLIVNKGRIAGVFAQDKTNNETFAINAAQVVDTTGRWSARLNKEAQNFRLAKGVHLILPDIGVTEALLLTAQSDGRVFFIIPWYGLTLVGTTDSDYAGDIDTLNIDDKDIDYLLTEANRALANVNWSKQDIIGNYAGLRVLKAGKESHPSMASRDWALVESKQGLLTSLGGKLTSAREDASIIVDAVCQKLNRQTACPTFGKPLPWLERSGYNNLLAKSYVRAKATGVDQKCVLWLVRRYGERIEQLFDICAHSPHLSEKIRPEIPFIWAELILCAEQEMVVHLDDLLRRRLPLLILAKLSTEDLLKIAKLVAPILNWEKTKLQIEIERCHINEL